MALNATHFYEKDLRCCSLPDTHHLHPHGAPPRPGRRVIQNKHSNRDRSMTYLLDESSYRRVDTVRRSSARSEDPPCPSSSTSMTLCQVPSASAPATTGTVSLLPATQGPPRHNAELVGSLRANSQAPAHHTPRYSVAWKAAMAGGCRYSMV